MSDEKSLRARLQALHSEVLTETIPPSLLAAAQRTAAAHALRDTQWRWGGMAASVLLSFGFGWTMHGQMHASTRPATLAFAHQAGLAHAAYVPEVKHPVEVDAAQQAHLVQWLSKRLDRPLKLADLNPQGYALVGGRLLPGEDGVRAQFMYQDAKGKRLTLYLGALKEARPPESSFQFSGEGKLARFYWVDQGFGYALSGDLPRAELLKLAETVYRQL
jgi:anti-sigma factor RsiW